MTTRKSLKAAEPETGTGVCNGAFVADSPAAAAPVAKQPKSIEDPVEHADHDHPRCGEYLDGIRALGRRETLRPLLLVIAFFVIHHWTGLSGLRPFMVPVFRQFGLPVDAHWLTVSWTTRPNARAGQSERKATLVTLSLMQVLSALLGIGGNVLCMFTVAWCGKRPLALTSIGGMAVACTALGSYHLYMSSFMEEEVGAETHWLPLVLFVGLFSFHSFGIGPIPWMILSEVFPYK
jgi:hypothetical protein